MNLYPLLLVAATCALTACAFPSTKYTDAPYVGGMYSKTLLLGYDGEPRPISEVGVMTQDGVLQVRKISRDGQVVPLRAISKKDYLHSTGRTQIHLLPGKYQVEFCFFASSPQRTAWCTTPVFRTVDMSAGQVKHYAFLERGRQWSTVEHDGTQDLAEIEADFKMLTSPPHKQ